MPEDTAAVLNDTDLVILISGGVEKKKRGPYSELLSGKTIQIEGLSLEEVRRRFSLYIK